MRIVVVGATGLIGSKVVTHLKGDGHEVVPAARSLGIDTITGQGLAEALDGASVVVDVSNSPSARRIPTARDFFETSTANLLAAETAADVRHHVVFVHRRHQARLRVAPISCPRTPATSVPSLSRKS